MEQKYIYHLHIEYEAEDFYDLSYDYYYSQEEKAIQDCCRIVKEDKELFEIIRECAINANKDDKYSLYDFLDKYVINTVTYDDFLRISISEIELR